jgi:hypothetical protein
MIIGGDSRDKRNRKVKIMMEVHAQLKYFVHAYVLFEKGSR